MKMTKLALLALPLWLASCADGSAPSGSGTSSQPISVCQGFGCKTTPGKTPSRAETHKPTKDEKIRARRGENPNFGSDEWSVGGSFPM